MPTTAAVAARSAALAGFGCDTLIEIVAAVIVYYRLTKGWAAWHGEDGAGGSP